MIKNFFYKLRALTVLGLILMIGSCASKENILYVQDIDNAFSNDALVYNPVIQNDDILSITVSSENMEAVALFNQNTTINSEGGTINTQQQENTGYLVDNNGEINFLKLGKITVAGKTRAEVIGLLTERLKQYIINPLVEVRLTNFKVTVLGEVARPGTFPITDNRVTLPQVLGMAGDLTIFADRKNVLLLRDDNGVQRTQRIDLTSANFIKNPSSYYLQQNDVIIISPNEARIQASDVSPNRALYFSIASLALTLTLIIINLTR